MNALTPTTMTQEQIIDLRRRVLAGEEVTSEELQLALSVLALKRVTASQGVAAKAAKTGNIAVKINLASAFSAFKQGRDSGGGSASVDAEGGGVGNVT